MSERPEAGCLGELWAPVFAQRVSTGLKFEVHVRYES